MKNYYFDPKSNAIAFEYIDKHAPNRVIVFPSACCYGNVVRQSLHSLLENGTYTVAHMR